MAIDLNDLATAIGQLILRFRLRRFTASQWTTDNPVLLSAELGVETDTGKAKLGDSTTAWNSLDYWAPAGLLIAGDGIDITGGTVSNVGIITVTAGANVDIDATDPRNIIISAASGGGSGGNIGPDDKPIVADAMDDEFEGVSLDLTKWTWQQQNTASAVVTQGSLVMTSQVTSGNVPNAIEQNLPSGNCAFVVKGNGFVPQSGNFAGAFHLRESATGDAVTAGVFNSSGAIEIVVASGTMAAGYTIVVTTLAAGAVAASITVRMYWKLEISGANIIISLSADGVLWAPIATLAFTSYFATAPDKVGMVVRGASSASASFLSVDYFRRIA